MLGISSFTVSVIDLVTFPKRFSALTLNEKLSALFGIPDTVAVFSSKVTPSGSLLLIKVHVMGFVHVTSSISEKYLPVVALSFEVAILALTGFSPVMVIVKGTKVVPALFFALILNV